MLVPGAQDPSVAEQIHFWYPADRAPSMGASRLQPSCVPLMCSWFLYLSTPHRRLMRWSQSPQKLRSDSMSPSSYNYLEEGTPAGERLALLDHLLHDETFPMQTIL